jgi:ribosomal-protein-alanine acetyltransferase
VRERLKNWWFRLRGKDPHAVVVTFATGEADMVGALAANVVALIPDRRHFLAGLDPLPEIDGFTPIPLRAGGVIPLWSQLRHALKRYRVGMSAVLFEGGREHRALRKAAFLLAPGKVLAYNQRLERHHLQWRTWLASWLFFRGVPLDRIHLRPRWLWWMTHDRTRVPDDPSLTQGRPPRPGFRRIGVLTPFIPFPLSHGGAVRVFHLLREASKEFDVFLFAFRENESEHHLTALLEFVSGVASVSKPYYREPRWATLTPPEVKEYESEPMRRLVGRALKEWRIDLLQVEYTQLALYPGAILVEHDITFDLYRQILRQRRTLAALWDWWRWRRFERAAFARYGSIVVMSAKDAALAAAKNVCVIPNGVDLIRFQPSPEPPGRRLLFVGSFRHFPNISAFRFFFDEVWPSIEREFPDALLNVVAGPDPSLYWQAATGKATLPSHPRMKLLEFVEDVRPLYVEANVVLVPTLVSAGTNLKVLEAMAMERAIVSTPSGVGGIPVEHGTHLLIAEPHEFCEAVALLLQDNARRRRLAVAARRLVEESYDWGRLGQMQHALYCELLPERLAIRPGVDGDVESIRRIQAESLPGSRWDALHYLRHELRVATWDGEVIGFIVARITAPDEREILNIAVDPAHRRRGIGESLLRDLLAPATGEVFLEVRKSNLSAQRLYRSVGFRDAGFRPNYYEDPPEDALIMRAALPLTTGAQGPVQKSSASERLT